jgi:hypothetical protein
LTNCRTTKSLTKIYSDHQHLPGFSKRNIRRNLPSDNASVPRRIRPSWPKNSSSETGEASELSDTIQEESQNALTSNDSGQTTAANHLQERPTEKEITTYTSKLDPSDKHNNALYEENVELKGALSRKNAFIKADEISLHEIEYIIPKEKGPNLEEAIQKCRDSVYVIFDKSGMLERAIPDIFREETSHVSKLSQIR